MLAMYLAAAAASALSLVIGQALLALAGSTRWSWLAPGTGFAALLCVASLGVGLPGHGWTALVLLLIAGAASARFLRRRPELRTAWGDATIAALTVAALASIPFLLHGRFGPLGAGILGDLGFHLAWAEALDSDAGAGPLIDPFNPGYPTGPHALVAALAQPLGYRGAFVGVIMAVPVLTTLTALGALEELRRPWRIAGAALTGLTYMAAAYYAEASFKEPMLGLFVLTFALALRELPLRETARAGIPLGLLAVGALLAFSYPGPALLALIGAAWAAVELVRHRRELAARTRALAPAAGAAIAIVAVATAVEWDNIDDFRTGAGENTGTEIGPGGNFYSQISARMVLGAWFAADFRVIPEDAVPSDLAFLFMLALAAYALVWWLLRRDFALPVAVLVTLAIYARARGQEAPYFSAKLLVAVAPALTLMTVRAIFAGPPLQAPLARRAWPALGIVLIAICGWSSLLVMRAASVGETNRQDELIGLRGVLRQGPTFFFGRDEYLRWALSGVTLSTGEPYGFKNQVPYVLRNEHPYHADQPLDFDSLPSEYLDRFRFVVTSRSPYRSFPPPSFRVVRQTPSYTVYEGTGPTPQRGTLDEQFEPGATFGCTAPEHQALARSRGRALIRPEPLIGPPDAWRVGPRGARPFIDSIGYANIGPRQAVEQTIDMPRGRSEIALQYKSPLELEVRVGSLRATLPPSLEPRGQHWSAGWASSAGEQTLSVRVRDDRPAAVDRVASIGAVTVTPGGGYRLVPLRHSCSQYVDWYEPPR